MNLAGKKILHLISSSAGLYGAENVLLSLAGSFQKQGIISCVGVIADARHPQPLILDRAKEMGLSMVLFRGQGRFDIGMVFRLCGYIRENKIDILHTHNYKSDLIGLLAAKAAGIPIIATAHGFTDMTRIVSWYERVDRFILRNFFKRVVVVSDKVLPNCSVEKKRVIPNGLDIVKFSSARTQVTAIKKKFNIHENDIVIGTAGRLSKEKNQRMLIEAFGQVVASSHVPLKLMILGDGPEKDRLQSLVQQMDLSQQVIFTGVVKEMPLMYQLMDIFVLSSLTEGVPLTILEAMAARVSVIATKVGGIPEIVADEENGLLVASQDTSGLILKIKILMNDKARRSKLAEQAFVMVQSQYSLEKMQSSYSKVYEEVLYG